MLTGIYIRNYALFRDHKAGALLDDYISGRVKEADALSSGAPVRIPFSNLNALIGRNKTGKSLFLDVLSFISDATLKGCAEASVLRGRSGFCAMISEGQKKMAFELCFKMNGVNGDKNKDVTWIEYSFVLEPDAHGRPEYSSEKVFILNNESDADKKLVLHVEKGHGEVDFSGKMIDVQLSDHRISALRTYGNIPQCPEIRELYYHISHWFFCKFSSPAHDNGNGKRAPVAPGGHRHLNSYGTNIQNVLDYIRIESPERYEKLKQHIYAKIPSVGKVKDKLPDEFRRSPNKLFLYLLLLADPRPRPLMCIETPDMELYHDMVDVLSAEFRDYSLRHPSKQIIFTTHNPYILESLTPEEVWVFKRDSENDTPVLDINSAGANPVVSEMYKQGVSMGAIWYAGHFDD